ncbi:MAG: chemotaxis response regulator protein-glutamate methylesterase [Alphaproteobacteria bacterium]|nr:chemotaxis response regulator protein-glutamate methylesterase [Alphaproteobacteria bacterium]
MEKKLKVLIVDDSAVVRQVMAEIIESDPELSVMATAPDPFIAAAKIAEQVPDVITLDIEMPKMDGLTFLEKLMSQHPIPVVMCSSLTEDGCASALKALACGAVGIITKPKVGVKEFLEESKILICDAIKAAAKANPKRITIKGMSEKKLTADVMLPKACPSAMIQTTEKIVAIGASTGGTEALRVVLRALPEDSPGIVVVQHMPEKFTAAFADQLNHECRVTVKEAQTDDPIKRGQVLIAPGNKHTMIRRSGAYYRVEVKEGPLVSRHRPSVDVLFRSAARYAGANVIGVIMTGMGDDGAKGMLEMREAKAFTMAQDESTCVVFGMPQEAIKIGGALKIVKLQDIATEIINAAQ